MSIFRQSHTEENNKTVQDSKILAKAVVRLNAGTENEQLRIIVVYSESSQRQFYWVYEAQTPSARKADRAKWVLVGNHVRDVAAYIYKDFATFIQDYIKRNAGSVLVSSRVFSRISLSEVTAKPKHFDVIADWTPRIASTDPRDYDRLHRKLQSVTRHTQANPWHKR